MLRCCEQSKLSGVCNGMDFLFQAVRRVVNVLNVSIYVYLNIPPAFVNVAAHL